MSYDGGANPPTGNPYQPADAPQTPYNAPEQSIFEKAKEQYRLHPYIVIGLAVVLVFLLVSMFAAEAFVNRTVNFIAYRHPDPTLYKYTSRERAPNGMDMDDYYLENEMQFKYGLDSELIGEAAFQSRVITEGTKLKVDNSKDVSKPINGEEDFVGGMSY